ncbi:MAG: trehalose-phosphatase [Acidobacteria bacterium]|nr:trehalose-phosphatase [Acidobacteriota bacterium]
MKTKASGPRPALAALAQIRRKIRHSHHLLLLLDYDGTLSPIAATPAQAVLPEKTATLLRELSNNPFATAAIVSGRSIADLRKVFRSRKVIYAGNHGLEISGQGLHFQHPGALQSRNAIRRISSELRKRLRGGNVQVEWKGFTASFHFRLASKREAAAVPRLLAECLGSNQVQVTRGKRVLEVRPAVRWDKGAAAVWIRRHVNGGRNACIYIGDDATDEDAFRALKNEVTVRVGYRRSSPARYYVENPKEVRTLLSFVSDCLAEWWVV